MALEKGSGFEQISHKFAELIDDEEFDKESNNVALKNVILRDKEHLYYYKIYESIFGSPMNEPCNSPRCSFCGSCLLHSRYCYTCGAFPPI